MAPIHFSLTLLLSPYSKTSNWPRRLLEPPKLASASYCAQPLLSLPIVSMLHSEWSFHNAQLKTCQWLPLVHTQESNSWSLTLPTGLCLSFQPLYVSFTPLPPILQPCWFSVGSSLRPLHKQFSWQECSFFLPFILHNLGFTLHIFFLEMPSMTP